MRGGIKAIFQHVEALAEHDFTAAVATEDAQPPQWFPSSVNVIALEDVTAEDLLVFPENHVGLLERFASGDHWKYVFCQNQYQVARGLGGRRSYVQYGVRELICPSFSVLHYCRRRFPRMRQSYVPYYIDTDRFQPQTEKRLQIAFVARKRSLEASFIHDQLRAEHQEFRDVPWVQLDGSSEQQIATALGNSAVFLSLSRFESFGLTTLEALACGCLTAGFTGVGGREYASTRNGFWVEEDDCVTCVARLAEAVRDRAAARRALSVDDTRGRGNGETLSAADVSSPADGLLAQAAQQPDLRRHGTGGRRGPGAPLVAPPEGGVPHQKPQGPARPRFEC